MSEFATGFDNCGNRIMSLMPNPPRRRAIPVGMAARVALSV
jgi:hypothetical protein